MANTRTIGIYIYISPKGSPKRWHKNGMEKEVERRWFVFLDLPTTRISNHDLRQTLFLEQDGWSRGVAFSRWFYLSIVPRAPWIPLARIRSRSSRWKFAEGHSSLSLSFSSFFFFSFFERRIGHDNDRFIGSRTHKRRVSTRRE